MTAMCWVLLVLALLCLGLAVLAVGRMRDAEDRVAGLEFDVAGFRRMYRAEVEKRRALERHMREWRP